jgi:hypothetical protein
MKDNEREPEFVHTSSTRANRQRTCCLCGSMQHLQCRGKKTHLAQDLATDNGALTCHVEQCFHRSYCLFSASIHVKEHKDNFLEELTHARSTAAIHEKLLVTFPTQQRRTLDANISVWCVQNLQRFQFPFRRVRLTQTLEQGGLVHRCELGQAILQRAGGEGTFDIQNAQQPCARFRAHANNWGKIIAKHLRLSCPRPCNVIQSTEVR